MARSLDQIVESLRKVLTDLVRSEKVSQVNLVENSEPVDSLSTVNTQHHNLHWYQLSRPQYIMINVCFFLVSLHLKVLIELEVQKAILLIESIWSMLT